MERSYATRADLEDVMAAVEALRYDLKDHRHDDVAAVTSLVESIAAYVMGPELPAGAGRDMTAARIVTQLRRAIDLDGVERRLDDMRDSIDDLTNVASAVTERVETLETSGRWSAAEWAMLAAAGIGGIASIATVIINVLAR